MRTTRWIEFNGERKALVEWAEQYAISPNVVRRGFGLRAAGRSKSLWPNLADTGLKRTWRLRP